MKEILIELLNGFESVKAGVNTRLAEYPDLAAQITMQLDKTINMLKLKAGIDVGGAVVEGEFPTISKLRGQDFEVGQKPAAKAPVDMKAIKEIADQNDSEELINKVNILEPLFLEIESDKLLDEHEDLVLRGVAKRAGLPVTETTPEKIDVAYINTIKEAIKEKAAIAQQGAGAGNTGNENLDNKTPDPLTAEIAKLEVDIVDDTITVDSIIANYSEVAIKALAAKAKVPEQKSITPAFILKIIDGLEELKNAD